MKKILFVLSLLVVVFFFTSSVSYSENNNGNCVDCDYVLSSDNLINPIDKIIDVIENNPYLTIEDVFRNEEDMDKLKTKIDYVLNRIKRKAYLDALKKLSRDVLSKVDGGKEDWMIESEEKDFVYLWAKDLKYCLLQLIYN